MRRIALVAGLAIVATIGGVVPASASLPIDRDRTDLVGTGLADRTQTDRAQADRAQADRAQADRTQADPAQADRAQADRGGRATPAPAGPRAAAGVRQAVASVPGPVSYAYDAAGRLAGMVAGDGSVARYAYDPAGNVTAVDRLGTPAVAVLAAVPQRVRPGDTVTITGKGFSVTAASNTVTINGAAATVQSATADKLVVTVPAGATSGPLQVSSPAGSASLAGITVLTSDKPVITGFTPTVAAPGTVVTLSVSNADPQFANNLVRLNGLLAAVSAQGPGTLTFAVPPNAGSGRPQLSTPTGTATATDTLVVPPAGIAPSALESTGPITVGARTNVAAGAGKYALRFFDAADGDRFAVVLDGGTFGSCSLSATLYDERNRQAATSSCVGVSGWVETSPTSGPGTRAVVLRNTGAAAGSVFVTVLRVPADLDAGTQALNGTTKTVTVANPGQNAFTTFAGTAGQRVLVQTSATSSAFGCCNLTWTLVAPDGSQVGGTKYANDTLDTIALPQTGTYRLVMNPAGALVGSTTFAAWTVPPDLDAGTLSLAGVARPISVASPGQNAFTTFTGTTGQRVLLQTSATSSVFGCCNLTWALYAPDGARVGSTKYANDTLDTTVLPQTGTYKVIVDPGYALVGSTTLTAWDVPPDVDAGAQPLDGTAKTITVGSPGQNAFTTFTGTTGQRVLLQTSATSAVFGCCNVTWTLNAPNGAQVGGTKYANDTLDTIVLPQDGTYRINWNPGYALTGSSTFSAWNVPADVDAGAQALDGTAKTITVGSPGQNAFTTFTGTTGQRVLIQTSATSPVFGCCNATWTLNAPNGAQVGGTKYANDTLDTLVLPQTGTYKINWNPAYALTGSSTFTAWDVPPDLDAGTQALDGTAKTVTITDPGRNASSTFTGTTNQRVIIQSTATSAVFGCCNATWTLNAPNGAQVGGTKYANDTLDTLVLPQTGTYKINWNPAYALTGSTTFTAWDVPADLDAGAQSLGGVAKAFTIGDPGRNAFSTFTGTVNQHLVVTSSNASPAFGCCNLTWTLTAPNGAQVGSTRYPGNTLDVSLPQAGAYKLVVNPAGTLVGSITLTANIVITGGGATAASPPQTDAPAAAPAVRSKALPPDADRRHPHAAARLEAPEFTAEAQALRQEQWTPDHGNLQGLDWLTRRGDAPAVEDLTAPTGSTAVSGHVLDLDGKPLAGIPVRMAGTGVRASTDAKGRFLLRDVPASATTIVVDGYAAETAPARYGTFRIRARVNAAATTPLDAPVWLPRLDLRSTVRLDSPTKSEIVLRTPDIPGLEVRIPAGTVVRDLDGKVVTELGITPIPIDRPPYPLPRNGIVPTFFTVQPGGSTIFPQGAQVVYPNYTRLPAGSTVDFWNYDPQDKGWYVYGHGRVSDDGRQALPDSDTRLWTLDGSMFNTPGNPKPDKPWWKDLLDALSGDPVDLSTGLLTDAHTDLGLNDTLPVTLTRAYYQGDGKARQFGLNQASAYDMFLASENQYQEVDLYLPGGGKVHYVRTSPGNCYCDAVFGATGSPGRFTGSTIAFTSSEWLLTLRDGTKYFFPMYSRLRAIQDRNGSQITFTRIGGSNGEVSQITSPNGRWISFQYDGSNRVISARDNIGRTVGYTYDTAGRLSTVVDVAGHTSTYAYDTANRITRITDARGVAYLDVTYDANGRVATQTLADAGAYSFAYTLGAAGQVTETRVTQPNGSVRRVVFDPVTRTMTSDTQAYGTALARTTTLVRGPSNRLDAVLDPFGRRTEYAYDAAGRPTSVTELAGTAGSAVVGSATYGAFDLPSTTTDAAGKVTGYAYDTRGNLVSTTDPLGRTTTVARTTAGLVSSITAPGSGTRSFTYESGALVSYQDALGRVSTRFVDAAGRPVVSTDPAGASTVTSYDAQDQVTRVVDPLGGEIGYGYDGNSNLTSLTDQRGKTTTWAYNGADQVTSTTDALARAATTGYDAAGRPTATVAPSGKRTEIDYDALDRVTRVRYGVSGSSSQSTVTYGYDAFDRLATLTDTTGGSTSFGYDALDQVTSSTGPNGTVSYGYDAAGRQTSVGLPGQPATAYGYDDVGRLTSASRGADATALAYDPAGRLATLTLPGGWTQTYAYDNAGQVTGIDYAQGGTSRGALAYGYDAAGRRASVSGSLATVELPGARGALVYDDTNRLVSAGGTPLTYDADGNLLTDGTSTLTWDARDQLATSSAAGVAASYAYDATGTRTSRTVNGASTRFVLDGVNPAAELDGAGATTATLLSGGTDQWFARSTAGVTDAVLTDALGSPVALGRADGSFAATHAYDPFGTPSTSGDARGSGLSFTGREDDGTGLLYYRARYYSPGTQRFVSPDPAGIAGGLNLYGYTANSPTNYTDPTGNNPIIAGCLIGGAIGGGLEYLGQRLSGRKVDWGLGGVGGAALGGCIGGALGGALGMAGRAAPKEFPPIKPGSAGGPTAGKPFPPSVRDGALRENPSTCVYCRMETNKPQVDHAIPRARGGNATPENAQTACPHCNASKGSRDFPVTPPSGYRGPWPPPWWGP